MRKRITAICSKLPEAQAELKGDHGIYTVRKKVFAYFLDNHHGDGIVAVAVKAFPGDNARLVADDPVRFYLPAYVGPRGWVARRLDVGKVDWEEVSELILGSYVLTAPKKLSAGLVQEV